MLFGSGEAFLVAVISPREAGVDQGTLDAIGAHVETVNAALPRDEWIVKTIVAPEPFTIEGGLLTSQYKPKRKEIFKKYNQEISKLYGVKA